MKTRKVPLEVNMDTDTTPFECDSCCEEVTDAEWYKCTSCIDYDMCKSCFFDNCHHEHKAFIHQFTDYISDGQPYCESCGIIFDDDVDEYVYQCKKCHDYGLCNTCYEKGMHGNHKKSMRRTPLVDLKDEMK